MDIHLCSACAKPMTPVNGVMGAFVCCAAECIYWRARSGTANGSFLIERARARIQKEADSHCRLGSFCSEHGSTDEGYLLQTISEMRELLKKSIDDQIDPNLLEDDIRQLLIVS